MGNKVFSAARIWALLAACLISATATATPEILDWDTQTWTPEGNTNLSETFTTGSGDITFTFGGNTAGLDQAGPVISPAINMQNTGGLVPAQNGLYVATDYLDNSNPMVTVTVDFTGYPGGVGNLSFMVFDMDNGGTFIDDMTVTAQTLSGPINPTSIVTSTANTQIGANTVRGTSGSAATSGNGNATFVFGDAGTPVTGITQILITWRNLIGSANPGFQWINIHDFNFDDPMADTELTKTVLPATASAGETVVFTLDVVNNGPDDAPSVQVTDQLPAGFTYVSDNGGGSYNPGSGIWDVGTLTPSGTAQLTIDATMEAAGPWDNSAEVTRLLATDPDSTPDNDVPAEDDQDNAVVTLVTPEIGTAKRVLATPINNGDGSYTLTYSILVENSGDVALNNVQVVDDLAATFAGTAGIVIDSVTSGDFTVNPGYNGSSDTDVLTGTDTLAVGVSGTVDITVTVDAGGNLGPFDNTANGSGTSPGGTGVSDASTTGSNPDPDGDGNPGNNSVPTAISFTENPQIGVAKAVSAGPVNNGDGSYTLDYRFTLENFGDGPLSNIQIVDNLATTFSGATGFVVDSVTSSDLTPNPGFDGIGDTNVLAGTDTMILAATGTVDVTVTVTPGGTLGPYNNNSFARAQAPGGALTIDNSVNGLDPDPDGNGDPVDNNSPTPVSFAENPEIGTAKAISAGPTNNGDGTYTLTYSIAVANSGDVTLNNVQVVDNLAATFAGATGFVVDSVTSGDFATNAGFDGIGDTNVLAGSDSLAAAATGTVDVTVTVTPGGSLGPYNNTATGSGTSPGGMGVSDDSTAGNDPDPDGDGDPGNNTTPTPVSFAESPEIGTAKAISAGPTNNGDGTYTLTYTMTLENSGDVALNNVQAVDNLAATFAGATGFVVDSVTSGDFATNAGFDGIGDTNVLTGSDSLAAAATGTVDVTVTVTPGGSLGPYNNTATGSGTSPGGMGVSDDSTAGNDPDPDGDGDPGNNTTPTPVSFAESPEIGTAKAISAGPTNNGDGTYTLTYSIAVANSGDVTLNNVQVVDNLAATFAGATGFVVDSVTSGDFATNAGFDGIGDTNVLAGSDSLAAAATGTVDVTVTVTPGGSLGPYNNTATGSGASPGGMGVSDDSTAGNDPDPDGDGDPGNNTTPTPVIFGEDPQIGVAKALTAGPVNNGDGTHTLTYTMTLENFGDVVLDSLQITDNLATTFAGATGFVVDSVTSADFTANPGFDGSGDTSLLAGSDSIAIAATGTVAVTVTVTPGGSLGPYDNTVFAQGSSPAGGLTFDNSVDGLDPDPDGNGDPVDNISPTPVTFSENPEIGTAKAISAGPTNNGDGTYTLTYTMTLENSGDVTLNNVQIVDNLATTFAGATGFVVDSVTSGDFATNASFDGSGDTNVLAGTDSLAAAATGTVDVTVTVTPGGSLGPYNNTATGSGTSPGGMGVSDDSTAGNDPDPDGDGDPGNNTTPTPVIFGEDPQIGVAKALTAGPVNNGDGTHTLTYTMTLENFGDVVLDSLQITDNLATTFAGATGFVVDSVTSGDFTTNAGFDGSGDTNLLAGTDSLAIAATGTLDVTVTVTPGATLGPYDNTVFAQGSSPAGGLTFDNSVDGLDPDPDGNGDPVDNNSPTPVSFAESPEIGTAKAISAGPTNNGDGTYTLTYTMTLENSGDVTLNNVQVVDNLAATFAGATGFVVDSVTSGDFATNAGFDGIGDTNVLAGTDSLAAAATGTVDVTVTVTPGGSLGPYNNTATGSGTSPGGMGVSDDSTAGNDPDPDGDGDPGNNTTPTPVSFAESPEIGTAKAISAGPTNNGDGTYTLTYTMTLENSGDVTLNNVQIVDNLATTFAGATGFVVDTVTSGDFATNAGFDGSGDTNVLAGSDSLAAAATGTVDVTVTVTPGGSLGPYNNTATGSGTSPGGMGVSDDSTAGNDPDPDGDGDPGNNTTPTPVIFGEDPQIGVAKALTAGPTNNGDGTYTLTYTMTLENFGDVVLDSLQITDNLATTFAGATGFVVDSVTSADFTANPGFDGSGDTNVLAGTDSLAIAATGTLDVTVTVTPGATLGPYDNTVFAQGSSPAGGLTFDNSVDGLDPDPDGNGDPVDNNSPTPVSFAESPEIGTAKAISAGPTNNGDGTYTLTYTMTLENSGDVTLNNVQAVDNLAATFAGATGFVVDSVTSGDFATNAGFDGIGDTNVLTGSDSLAAAATGTVDVTVTVTPGGSLGPYNNTATGSGTSPGGMGVSDDSTAGNDPDPDGDGDPGNNTTPTPVSFAESPEIGTAKAISAGPTNNGDGTYTLTYSIAVANSGDVTLNNVQVVDNLAATFAGATGFVVDSVTSGDFATNAGFDGIGDTNVLAGSDSLAAAATGTVDVTVTVTPGGSLGPYNNTATGSGTSPGGMGVSDDSTAGNDPDPDGDGDPGNNTTPTPVSFAESPEIGTAKAISAGPTNNGDGTYTLTYTMTLENSGDVALNNVQAVDNLAATFAGATGFVVDSVTSGDFATNAGFDGIGDTNVLTGSDSLAAAATGTVDVTVTVTPGGSLGPYNNTATGSGTSPGGMGVSDDSTAGSDPDPDGDGDPANNSTPTPVVFGETPLIGVAKALTAGPANNGDGTYTLTYTMTLENFGDVVLDNVQVVDNLSTTFSGATGFVVNSVNSGDFTVNAGFDGSGDTNVLAGGVSLAVAASGTVDVTVTVTPGGNLGPYDNAVVAQGSSPSGGLTVDNSVDGLDPDPDGNDDPADNTGPTPVTFGENPEIGTAKSISAGPANNGDGTYMLTYTVTVENSGDVTLNNVQVVDDLSATFAGATGFVVDSVTSGDFAVNAGFDGSGDTDLLSGADSLAVTATGTVDVTVTVTPGGNLGPYDNTATAGGTSPGGMGVSDDSTDGADPDPDGDGDPGNNSTPTPVTFGESPEIGTAKSISAGPANNGDGTYMLTYTVTVENSGDVTLNNVQVVDDLSTTFASATGFVVDSVTSAEFTVNAGYDGSGDTSLLSGTDSLATTAGGTVVITVTFTPGGNLGPYDNTATSSGTSPGGTGVSDDSTDGADPDPDGDGDPGNNSTPTTLTAAEDPEIGTAKTISGTPVNNGDGTFTLTYTVTVENSGDVVLNNVQVVDNLATTFAGATGFVVDSVTSGDFTVNAGYDGSGDTNLLAASDSLAAAATGTVNVTVTVTPGGNLGPYDNTATSSGTSPGGTGVSDDSTAGSDADPDGDGDPGNDATPTTVIFGENPQIGVAKALTAGPVNNGDGTHTLTYTFSVENFGDVVLDTVQVVDNLAATFGGATGFVIDMLSSADFAVNPAFDGDTDRNLLDGSDSLALAGTGAIQLSLTVTPGANPGPYDNAVFAQGSSPAGGLALDNSVDGLDPDPDGNGDPADNIGPTPVSFVENPVIGTAKAISGAPVNNGDGTFTLTYTVVVENAGDVVLDNVQVAEDLAVTFAAASAFVVDSLTSADFAVNAGYDGDGDTNLLTGADALAIATTGSIEFTVTVTPGANLGPYDNIAAGSGTSPGGTVVSDDSTTGSDTDPDGDGDPTNDSTPTTVVFGENPGIGTAKAATVPVNNGDGTFTLTYTIFVENSGDVTLDNVRVAEDLGATFAGATGFVIDAVTGAGFTVNPGFDGVGDTGLLSGSDSLAVAASGSIDVTVTVTPGGSPGPYDNSAVASGVSPSGVPVSDVSTTGTDPDPGNDGPGNDDTPTPVSFDPGVSGISGSAWLDENTDDLFESDELPTTGWFVDLLQNGVVIATVPVGADGSYSFDNLPPGSGYSVQLRHPTSNAVFAVVNDITLPPNVTVTEQNLPVDPSGVFYDAVTRLPVAGVLVSIVDSGGTPLPAACLLPGQQDQVTGADGFYRFDVLVDADPACASGATFGIVFTAPSVYVPGVSALIPPAPGTLDASGQPDPFRVQPQSGPPTGAASTLYYLGVTLSAGDPNIINNHIPVDPVSASANLNVSKRADRRQTTIGELVAYTVTIENPGAAISGLTLSDLIPAGFTYVTGSARLQPASGLTVTGQRPVSFDNIDVAADGTTQLRYMLRVGAGVVQGDYTNTVTPLIGNTAVGNSASATVTVTADPDFEQTTIVGMVFNDSNGDGWQDEGEAGIPGVRLATVEGLIIETDAFGRYHLAGVDGGRRDRGRNFIVKVDQASLPDGVEFTTENPRVQRITEGLLNRFDFGVRMPQSDCCKQIDVKIGEIFFEEGSSNVRPEFLPLVNQLADRLRESGGGTLFIEGYAEPSEALPYSSDTYTVTQHFAPRSTALRAEDKRELDAIIARWRGVENVSVSAVGHTCNTPIAPANRKEFRDNYELSRARAQAVASYVRVGLGIAPEQVSITGKGPDEPVASNATPQGGAMNRRVDLTISGQRTTGAATPADLARDRANRVLEMLRDLLGDDLVRRIEIQTAPSAGERRETEMTSDATPAWLQRGTGLLLGLLIGTAHADTLPQACTVDSCRTDEGYAIQILPSAGEPSPMDTGAARASDQRVDLSGRFWVPVGGGMLWATEDPSAAQPRLALHGPELVPVADGKLAMPVSFFVYSNYAAFIDKAEIRIYHGNDIDLIEPLAVVPFKPGVFSHIDWQPEGLPRRLDAGDELYYRVRAWDGDGRYDETHLEHLRLVGMDEYKRSAEADPDLLLPEEAGMHKTSVSSRGPLDGNVLVLQTPGATQYLTRGSYSVTPHFDTRKTDLKPEDRVDLDRIVAEWTGARDLRLHVIGHTDSVRIAPQHRNEFRDNQALSEARARAVTDYLAGRMNLDRTRITSEGRAASEPVASNATAAGRARNRRVEVTISGERPAGAAGLSARTTLVEPYSDTTVNIGNTLEEALNLLGARLGDDASTTAGRNADVTVAQSSAHALEATYGRSDLRVQRIPVNGSRVRINGQDIGGNIALRINGEPVPLDAGGKYAVEYLMPVGSHEFDVELIDEKGGVTDRRRLPVDVSGKHIFLVALADVTVSDNNVSGSVEPLRADDRYDDDLLVEGRLAFYLKGKIKGKYLITAQLDSQEEEIGDLFSNIFDKDPKSVLRRLDPDRYYPVYGDDSTTISDTDSQGRLYFRADWDRSSATWGNFHTGFTGNEFAQYNRSLYGAQYIHESLKVTSKGESKTEAIAFLSEAQTGFGHSEFVGTGGSLYYLKHQDILPGSEKAWVEVRDRDSDRVRELVTLVRGIDYEVDEIQGRIILSRPLMQVSRLNAPGIVKDTPLDGDELVLLVDYEYIPNGFSPDKVTLGGRGRHWVTDDIAVGATLVNENRETEDYSLLGGDILWQPGEGTYVKAEYAQSEASQADRFQSSDGGLTFDSVTPVAAGRQGDAWGIEARINSRETMNTDNEWVGGGWYRRTDDNYSVARRDPGVDTTEYGLELTGHLSDRMNISARGSVVERETLDRDRRLGLQIDYALTDRSLLSGEVRSIEETRTGTSADGMLLALRYSYALSDAVEIFGIGQFTLDNDSGRYDNNDLATVGASVDLNGRTTLQGEYSTGHRGEGALLSMDYRLDDRHEVYGTFTQSADRTDLREPGTRIALGHRSRITDQATLFNERQFIEDRDQAGLTHVFGLDFDLASGWAFGISMQSGDLETKQGNVDRDSATFTANYRSGRLSWRGKAEYRNENGSSDVRQVLTTNRMDLKLSEDWRLLTRLSHSETEDQTLSDRDDSALFTEAGVGFAYRPVANNRLNLLAKYTFLYDLPAPEQIDGGTDQRSHVVSVEGIYRLNPRWELGGKLAQRRGELRVDRDFGQWFESTTNFYALRGRYHLIRRWDAMLEYRSLDVDEAGSTRDGWLVALDRHINDHFRLGIGYNFTDFSDDLTNLDYDHDGWFVNAVGKY